VKSSRCSARTAPARPPRWRCSKATVRRTSGPVIGVVLQEAGFDKDFTPSGELVRHQRSLYPRQLDVDDVLALGGLVEKAANVFGAGEPPAWLSTAASALPVKPLAGSLSAARHEAGPDEAGA
jgi:hypothetical protein